MGDRTKMKSWLNRRRQRIRWLKVDWLSSGISLVAHHVTLMEMIIASAGFELAQWTVRMKKAPAIRMSSVRDSAPIRAWPVPSRTRSWSRLIAMRRGGGGRGRPRSPPSHPSRPSPRSPPPSPPPPDPVGKRRWIGVMNTNGFCCLIVSSNCRSCRRRWGPARVTVTVNVSTITESIPSRRIYPVNPLKFHFKKEMRTMFSISHQEMSRTASRVSRESLCRSSDDDGMVFYDPKRIAQESLDIDWCLSISGTWFRRISLNFYSFDGWKPHKGRRSIIHSRVMRSLNMRTVNRRYWRNWKPIVVSIRNLKQELCWATNALPETLFDCSINIFDRVDLFDWNCPAFWAFFSLFGWLHYSSLPWFLHTSLFFYYYLFSVTCYSFSFTWSFGDLNDWILSDSTQSWTRQYLCHVFIIIIAVIHYRRYGFFYSFISVWITFRLLGC